MIRQVLLMVIQIKKHFKVLINISEHCIKKFSSKIFNNFLKSIDMGKWSNKI